MAAGIRNPSTTGLLPDITIRRDVVARSIAIRAQSDGVEADGIYCIHNQHRCRSRLGVRLAADIMEHTMGSRSFRGQSIVGAPTERASRKYLFHVLEYSRGRQPGVPDLV